MADKISWIFEVIDRVTNPVRSMGDRIKKFTFDLDHLLGAAQKTKQAFEWIAESVTAPAKWYINAVSFKENTLAAFEAMLGTKDEAAAVFNSITKMAQATPFDANDLLQNFQVLIGYGMEANDAFKVLQATMDVAATRGFDPGILAQLTGQLGQVATSTKLYGSELKTMAQAGLDIDNIYEKIGKRMGKTAQQVKDLQKAGSPVGADIFFAAYLDDALEKGKKLGGAIGAVTLSQSKTISALISKLKELPTALVNASKLDVSDMPGIGALKEALTFLDTFTDDTGTRFAKLQTILFGFIGGFIGAILKPFTGGQGQDLAKTMDAILDKLSQTDWIAFWEKVIEKIYAAIGAIGQLLKLMGRAAEWLGIDLRGPEERLREAQAKLQERQTINNTNKVDAGDSLFKKIIGGLTTPASPTGYAQNDWGVWTQDTESLRLQKQVAEAQAELARSKGGGLLAGIPGFAEGGIVTRPTLAMVGERGPEAIVPLRGAGGMTNNITIHVSGDRGVAQSISAELTQFFDRLAAEGGVA